MSHRRACCCTPRPCQYCSDPVPRRWYLEVTASASGCYNRSFSGSIRLNYGSLSGQFTLTQDPVNPCLWVSEPVSVGTSDWYLGTGCTGTPDTNTPIYWVLRYRNNGGVTERQLYLTGNKDVTADTDASAGPFGADVCGTGDMTADLMANGAMDISLTNWGTVTLSRNPFP